MNDKTPAEIPENAGLSSRSAYDGTWSARSVYALGLLTLIYTLNYVDRQTLSIVLPLLKSELHLTDLSLGIVSGLAFVLFYSLLSIPIARLADRTNRRNLLALGLAFWSVMTLLTGAVANVWQLGVTRFLMGAGEATAIAPSTSMTSDMFGGKRRTLALGILTSGTSLSALLFLPIIGWISQHYGWRATFAAAGAPGLALAFLLRFTIEEPTNVSIRTRITQEVFPSTVRFLCATPTYVYTVLGAAILGVSLYASQIWNPSFLARVHHLDQTHIGAAIGVGRGLAGLLGALSGGYLAGHMAARDARWAILVPGIACVLIFPAQMLFLLSPGLTWSLVGYSLSSFFLGMHFGPIYSVCQMVSRATMRATSVAVYVLFANVLGQIAGPTLIGFLNDRWTSQLGASSIRYSLALLSLCALAGGGLMVLGARTLKADMAKADLHPTPVP